MANLFADFIRKHLVDTVPEAMDLCLSCKQAQCGPEGFRHCGPRLARVKELRASDAPGTLPEDGERPGRPPAPVTAGPSRSSRKARGP
jgi:hypothetical protein